MARTFVIGDIHGALKALDQLVQKIKPKAEDKLIFLGDYVDGWSQSAQVISRLMELDARYNCIFMKGNHDEWCESWLMGKPADPVWLFHGGRSTVESYETLNAAEKITHITFYNRLRPFYIDEKNRLFIHAGFASMHGPEHERYETSFLWDRTLWETARSMNKRMSKNSLLYPRRLQLFHEIYIGHTPTINYNKFLPMKAANLWNVDTGAAFYGKLSALDIDSKKVIQSDPPQQLYPGEKGRNP